jgi:signal transduction histidine kinase
MMMASQTFLSNRFNDLQHNVEELHALNCLYQEIIKSLPQKAVVIDTDLAILWYNDNLTDLFSDITGDKVGQNIFAVLPFYNHAELQATIRECISFPGPSYKKHLTIHTGQDQWLQFYVTRLNSDVYAGAVLILSEDISAPNPAHVNMFRAEGLKHVSSVVGQIVHDIYNPLSAMMTLLDFLRKDDIHVRTDGVHSFQDQIDLIQDQTKRIVSLLDNVRPLNNFDVKFVAATPFHMLVERAIAIADLRRIGSQAPQISVNLPDDLPPIHCCESSLVHAVSEIYLNAVDAAGAEGTVNVTLEYRDVRDGEFVLQVADSGSGIPEEKLNKMFDLYYSTKKGKKKPGLGLLIAYTVILMHNGNMHISSPPGQGTVVTVVLPRVAKVNNI